MPRRNFNDGQELSYVDFNAIGPAIQKELYDLICYELVGRKTDAFFMDSFEVEFATSTSVTVKAGVGFQYDSTQVSPEPMRRLLYNAAQATKNLSAADATHPRKDIVCVKAALVTELTGSRRYKDPSTSAITTETMTLQKEWEADIITVTGTPAASPSAPATPAGYLRIAVCTVNAVTGMSGASDVVDERVLLEYGANAMLDTSGYERITASANIGLGAVMLEVDGLLDDALDDLSAKTTTIANMKKRNVEDWNVAYTYATGDVVQDGSGNLFKALSASTGQALTSFTYWKLVSEGLPRSATITYQLGDTVRSSDGKSQYAATMNGVTEDTTDATRWRPVVQNGLDSSVTGPTATLNCQANCVFDSAAGAGGNKTFTISKMHDGQTINVNVYGAAGNTVTWTLTTAKAENNQALTAKTGITYSNTMTSGQSLYTLTRIGSVCIINSLHGIA